MLPDNLVPTPLIPDLERPAIAINVDRRASRFRALRILSVLLGLLARLLLWRLSGKLDPARAGAETRLRLEQLGGMWIKVGQLLSLRVDLFPDAFWIELSKLQDQARGFSPQIARAAIEHELGGPLENYFTDFQSEPFAAASTAQVHRARLLGNRVEVAIKIQRPHIERSTRREMRLLHKIARILDTFGLWSFLQLDRLNSELREIMAEELDYRYEASNIKRMSRTLKKHHIFVPKVFMEISTKRLLVTEWISGVLMSDYIYMIKKDSARLAAWCEENGIDPQLVGRRLVFSLLRQIFEDNLYHGDLHPGNIMLLRDSRVALIDLGAVGFTDNEFLGRYRLFIRSVAESDFAKAADSLLLLGDVVPPENLNRARAELIHTLRVWSLRTQVTALPFHERSLSTVSTALLQVLAPARVTPDWSFLRIRRAEHTLDASIVHLLPTINYSKLGSRYFRRYDRRRLERFIVDAPNEMTSGAIAAVEMGQHALEQTLFTASVTRRDAIALGTSLSNLSYFVKLVLTHLIIGLSALGVFAVMCLLHQHPITGSPATTGSLYELLDSMPRLGVLSWLLILLGDAYLIMIIWHLRTRLQKTDRWGWRTGR
ncbi:MAG: AarF/ABC1/UbiB kinase family protein [Hyphomicrobiales bacterium]|nr:AarF/ABC1/UbiB kinase family protein [Hyphomicrobiales bacterium]